VKSGSVARETWTPDDRLRKRREFEECYASGVRASGRLLQVFLRPNPERAQARIGISVPRRVGPAVARNRIRRRLREIFRRGKPLGPRGGDLVVHVRPAASRATFAELAEELSALVSRAGSRMGSRDR